MILGKAGLINTDNNLMAQVHHSHVRLHNSHPRTKNVRLDTVEGVRGARVSGQPMVMLISHVCALYKTLLRSI